MRAFSTNSEQWAGMNESGKYPSKLYNESCVLIYQVDNGGDNVGKLPSGGVIGLWTDASSMSEVVANPITFYGNNSAVIDQTRQSGDLYNYYWTSYSRGTDGKSFPEAYNPLWHNLYLDSYIPLRYKSIYDPCPYGYRIPSNGTYNDYKLNINSLWRGYSYIGGELWNNSWIAGLGFRNDLGAFFSVGYRFIYTTSTKALINTGYVIHVFSNLIQNNRHSWTHNACNSIRCIEECELLTDATKIGAKIKLYSIVASVKN